MQPWNELVLSAQLKSYGTTLNEMVDAFERSERDAIDVHDLLADLKSLSNRMIESSTAATGTRLGGHGRRWPQEVTQ